MKNGEQKHPTGKKIIKMSSLNGSCGACIGKLLNRKYLFILAKGCFVQVINSIKYMSEPRQNFLLVKTNQPEISGLLGTYSKFSKGLKEHVQGGFELSEKGLRELNTVLTERWTW